MVVVAIGEVAIVVVVVVVVAGEIVVVGVVDEDYQMNDLVHFDAYNRVDFDHRS